MVDWSRLDEDLENLALTRQEYPIWTDWGVADLSTTIHSLGLSYLVTLGQKLGFVSCCEYPVVGDQVRVDAIWWDQENQGVRAIFEFERFKDQNEFVAKTKNLMRAYHEISKGEPGFAPNVLGLLYWTDSPVGLPAEALKGIKSTALKGFKGKHGEWVGSIPLKRLRVYECRHTNTDGKLRLVKIRRRRKL